MAMTERIVVLMTSQQKQHIRQLAAAERMSMSGYMRQRALAEDEILSAMLGELTASTARAAAAIDSTLARLEASERCWPEVDATVGRRAIAEFGALGLDLSAQITDQGRSA